MALGWAVSTKIFLVGNTSHQLMAVDDHIRKVVWLILAGALKSGAAGEHSLLYISCTAPGSLVFCALVGNTASTSYLTGLAWYHVLPWGVHLLCCRILCTPFGNTTPTSCSPWGTQHVITCSATILPHQAQPPLSSTQAPPPHPVPPPGAQPLPSAPYHGRLASLVVHVGQTHQLIARRQGRIKRAVSKLIL